MILDSWGRSPVFKDWRQAASFYEHFAAWVRVIAGRYSSDGKVVLPGNGQIDFSDLKEKLKTDNVFLIL